MSDLLPFVIAGLVSGSIYGLGGMGLVLTYRTSGVFNFGHGATAAGAAYFFYTLQDHGLPWPIAAVITLITFTVVVGFLMERFAWAIADASVAVTVVATVGLLLAVTGLLFLFYGESPRPADPFLPLSGFKVGGVFISWGQVISTVLATALAVVLYLFLRFARLGLAMRAVVDNPTLIGLTGERPPRVRLSAWAIGSAFAALSGMLLAPVLGLDAFLLTLLVVQSFGACALGLFKSLPLTYAGGLLIGVLSSVATKYLTSFELSGLPPTTPFLVLMVVLLVVPARRFPQRRIEMKSRVAVAATVVDRRVRLLLAALGVLFLLAVPALVGVRLPLWINACTYVLIFGSLALLVWTSGQISLCHAAFVAVGATTMSHLAYDRQVPWLIALLLAGAAAIPVGAIVALPASRLSGLYLALVTLGFGVLMQNVVYATPLMFGRGLVVAAQRPTLGFIDGTNDTTYYYIVLAIAAVTCVVLRAVSLGQLGRLLGAMAETPTMLTTSGLGLSVTRLLVFCLSAFLASVGGAMSVTQFRGASGSVYGPLLSLTFLAVLTVCGSRLLRSSILAAALFVLVPGYVEGFSTSYQLLAFGFATIVAAIAMSKQAELDAWRAKAVRVSAYRRTTGPIRAGRRSPSSPIGEPA